MKKTVDNCVDCTDTSYCVWCNKKNPSEINCCDVCETEIENKYYNLDGDMLCKDCAREHIMKNIDECIEDMLDNAVRYLGM